MAAPSGLLIIDKPAGPTSAAIVADIKRRVGRSVKVGHAGTLDPLATGVLIIAIGRATKQVSTLMAATKRYRTCINLSAFTTTDDAEGDRTDVAVVRPPERGEIEALLNARFTGEIDQAPPVYSAIKVGGRRAYALARKGHAPRLEARRVLVEAIEVVDYRWPRVEIDVVCGKGFYVRSLARDLGQALGTGGFCESIRRTAVGRFTIDQALTMDRLPETIGAEELIEPAA